MDAKLKIYKNICFHQVQRNGVSTIIFSTANKYFRMDSQKTRAL